jgi:hypothetical protein
VKEPLVLPIKDVLGKTISVGDYVMYPGRQGSSIWVTVAHVLEIAGRTTWSGVVPFVRVQPIDAKSRRAVGKPSPLTRLDLLTKVDLPCAEV